MRKSFALCEAFGLTPFPSPWIPPFQDAAAKRTRGALRRQAAADTAVRGGEALLGTLTRAGGGPPLRYGLLREGQGWGWRTTTAVRHAPVARP